MNNTGIEWCDYSSNVIRYRNADGKTVWACAKVSDGCKNCYSEATAHRYRKGGPFTLQQVRKVTPYFDEGEAKKLLTSKKLSGKRVFIGDMTDVFGEWVPFEILDQLFAVFALRPDVTFQVLTKRPQRMAEYLNQSYMPGAICDTAILKFRKYLHESEWKEHESGTYKKLVGPTWPLENVWLGCSVEDQPNADSRLPHLRECPAAIRFLSVEPLLSKIRLNLDGIDWVIIGGESGPHARPCDIDWIRSIVEQCKEADVAVFVKQLGKWIGGNHEFEQWQGVIDRWLLEDESGEQSVYKRPILRAQYCPQFYDERPLNAVAWGLGDSKGGDWDEWPKDLKVRHFPLQQAVA